jgi:HTH-type transcriptional regulator, transcriptional repressor of NAD biosynthesis genes
MIRGLVIGKFMPVHKGHIALINFAAAKCDELIVSMSYTNNDPISFELRFAWLKSIFKEQPHIKVHTIKDDFDDEALSLHKRTGVWAKRMKEYYPAIDVIFSSENYGEPFAENLGAKHIVFDVNRKAVPVSATLIRNKPVTYWDYIPETVKRYFVKKVCFYGPESTGKTTMAKLMAEQYHTTWVPEAARGMLVSNYFSVDDIIHIGITHDSYLAEKSATANKILFCDTDLLTTQIYAKHYFNFVPPILFELEQKATYDIYFLMDIDTPWVADHLRDNGERRKEMMQLFKAELEKRNIPYILISGNYKEREIKVRYEIDTLLQQF